MALGFFSAKFILLSSSPSGQYFTIEARITDYTGFSTGIDVQVNDNLYLDISNFHVDKSVVARYRVVNVIGQDIKRVILEIEYSDGGPTLPNPSDHINQPGIIVRTTPNLSLGLIPSHDLQDIPAYLEKYAFDIDELKQIDPLGSSGMGGAIEVRGSSGSFPNVNVLEFDMDTGFGVTGMGPGAVKVYLGFTGAGGSDLLGIPYVGGWTGGFFEEWTPSYKKTDGLWDIDDILKYLAPVDAATLNATDLVIGGTTVYSGRLSAGNISYPSGFPAGSNYSTIITNATFILSTAASPVFNKADKGAINAYIIGSFEDTFDLGAAFDEAFRTSSQMYPPITTVTGIVTIESVGWYNNFPKWQRGAAHLNIIPSLLRQGYNYLSVTHSGIPFIQQTNNFNLFWDKGVLLPVATTPTVAQNTPTYRYLSGIKFYYRGSTFNLSAAASNVFDNTYHSTSPVIWASSNNTMNNGIIDWNDASVSGVSFPPDISDTTMTITNKLITTPASNVRSVNAVASVTARKPWATSVAVSSASVNRLIDAYDTTSTEVYEYFDDEYRRLNPGTYSVIPAPIVGVWDSTAILVNGNAQVYNGSLFYPTINFSSGYLPAQDLPARNYSGFLGNQVYYRAMYKNVPKSAGTLEFMSLVSADIASVGSGNVNVEIKLPSQTGWLDLGKGFDSGTFTGADGDGCQVTVSGNSWSWTCGTFTTALSGFMTVIRVTLRNSSKQIDSIRETAW